MGDSKETAERIRAELKKLSGEWRAGRGGSGSSFLKKYQELLHELFRAEHPELGEPYA